MEDFQDQTNIKNHYHQNQLLFQIEKTLEQHGQSLASLTLKDLAAFDELHVGGKKASRVLASKADLKPGQFLLDIGSGIGGPARMLSHEYDLRVIGIDLTESFCQVASVLSRSVGIKENLDFVTANALALPLGSNSVDAVWTQHCSMNIGNKSLFYREIHRVLKPKGKLLIHDVVSGNNHPVLYPVPWASSEQGSFLVTASSMKDLLEQSEFHCLLWQDISTSALAWYDALKQNKGAQKPPVLNQKLVFGDSLKTMARNMQHNLKQDCIRIIESIWEAA